MLGGSSQKDPGAPVLKKVRLGSDKHVFIPVNNNPGQQMMAVPTQTAGSGATGSPRLVMVKGPEMTAAMKGQSILVPMNTPPGAKIIPSGSPVVQSPVIINNKPGPKSSKKTQVMTPKTILPGNMIPGADPNKRVIFMQGPPPSARGTQQVLVPVNKGSKGGQMIMVPVSSAANLTPSTSPSQQTLKPGISLMPVSQGVKKSSLPAPNFVKVVQSDGTKSKTVIPGPKGPLLIPAPPGQKMPFKMPGGVPANAKTVFIPDSALGSLPKGVQLIPLSGMPNQRQSSPASIGNMPPGGKVVFVQNPPGTTANQFRTITKDSKGKGVVVVGGPEGRPVTIRGPKPVTRLVSGGSGSQITYRNLGASHLPSMLNKPIKPKPVIQTSDTFFRTPIEIKPLEEERDDDLDDVLNALQGGGQQLDLVPLNTSPARAPPPPAPVTPEVEDFGLKIDSVYSLSGDAEAISWDDKDLSDQAESSGQQSKDSSEDKSDKSKSPKKADEPDPTGEKDSEEAKGKLASSREPLLPEDQPSQSGQSNSAQSDEASSSEPTDMDTEDPKEEVGGKDDDGPNLMRGDCLQVRLAQQAARQLQEQMRQESEQLSLVQAEWDEDKANQGAGKEEDKVKRSQSPTEDYMDVDTDIEGEEDDNSKDSNESKKDSSESTSGTNSESKTKESQETKNSKDDSEKTDEKTEEGIDIGDDVAKKALMAATLNGCEVPDEDLNEMFDELISEYLTTPERPKPSVRVRGIAECKAYFEDSPQSLVTTTQQSHQVPPNTSLLPRTIHTQPQDSRMKPKQLKTAAGTITLIPVKVPVPGKPGETTIKYIPMQLPSDKGEGAKNPARQFIKIMPSASKSDTNKSVAPTITTSGSQTMVSSGAASTTATTAQAIKPSNTVLAPSSSVVSTAGANPNTLLKMVPLAPSATATVTTASVPSKGKALSNEEMAKAIVGATRNVLGKVPDATAKLPIPAKPQMMYAPGPSAGMPPLIMGKVPLHIKPGSMITQAGGKLLLINKPASMASTVTTASTPSQVSLTNLKVPKIAGMDVQSTGSELIIKKKKKKKKKLKLKNLPKTKKCSVRLRKLNMRVIKNNSVNLKRVKKAWLFEAISRTPRREAKRKVEEMDLSDDLPPAKRLKEEPSCEDTKPAEPASPASPLATSEQIQAMANAPTLYKIMSQLPAIRPAPPGMSRDSHILHPHQQTPQMRLQFSPSKASAGSGVSLLSNSALRLANPTKKLGINTASSNNIIPSTSKITFTLSCTTPNSAAMSSQSVCTSTSKTSTILTPSCSSPVLSPPGAGKFQSSPPTGKSSTVRQSLEMPRMPTLLPAGVRMMAPSLQQQGPPTMRPAMPTLQPAPRSLLLKQSPAGPSTPFPVCSPPPRPKVQSPARPPLPVIRPKPPGGGGGAGVRSPPPLVIQPTGADQSSSSTSAAASGASSSSQGAATPSGGATSNKKYLLIKTSAGQFLVPVPTSKPSSQSGASGAAAAGPITTTTATTSGLVGPISGSGPNMTLQMNLPAPTPAVVSQPQIAIAPTSTAAPTTRPTPTTSSSSSGSNVRNNAPSPPTKTKSPQPAPSTPTATAIKIKDEPKDSGYDKYDNSSSKPKRPDQNRRPESQIDNNSSNDKSEDGKSDDGEESEHDEPVPRVAASVCHKQRIEELKARLREHEQQLLDLKKKREDTKKILESLDAEESDD